MEESENLKGRIINYISTLIGIVILVFALFFKDNTFTFFMYLLSSVIVIGFTSTLGI